MLVNVVMPTYNGAAFVEEAILSVVNQTYSSWILSIVDDGSTDNTVDIIAEYAKKHPGRIFVFDKRGPKGAPASRNQAVEDQSSDYISFIDQDDIWVKEKLEVQIERIGNGRFDLVYADIRFINHQGSLIKMRTRQKSNTRLEKMTSDDSIEIAKQIVIDCPIRVVTAFIKRSSYLSVGGYNENVYGGEDWDLWVRLCLAGAKIEHIKMPLAYRRVHKNNTSVVSRSRRVESWMLLAKDLCVSHKELSGAVAELHARKCFVTMLKCGMAGAPNKALSTFKFFSRNRLLKQSSLFFLLLLLPLIYLVYPVSFLHKDRNSKS